VVTQAINYETGDAAFAVDRSGVIVQWNSAAEKMLGYPASKVKGRKCWNVLRGKDTYGNRYCCQHCTVRKMAFQHESVNGFKVVYRTASKVRKKFIISCLAVFNSDGVEELLHICRPENEVLQDGNYHLATTTLAENQLGTLTRREIEALRLLAEGKNTREIASMMAVSTNTACNHIQHVLKKLHVHTRLEAVVLGKRLNLI
jgi:DNA-binding CsgD family transcriptional regulator